LGASRGWTNSKVAEWLSGEAPSQAPLLDERLIARLEERELERIELLSVMESDDTLIGRILQGRIGTSMRGKGGILPWAQPIYIAHKKARDRRELRRSA